jgi:hypothetical protein
MIPLKCKRSYFLSYTGAEQHFPFTLTYVATVMARSKNLSPMTKSCRGHEAKMKAGKSVQILHTQSPPSLHLILYLSLLTSAIRGSVIHFLSNLYSCNGFEAPRQKDFLSAHLRRVVLAGRTRTAIDSSPHLTKTAYTTHYRGSEEHTTVFFDTSSML